jgi:hypothetical protein
LIEEKTNEIIVFAEGEPETLGVENCFCGSVIKNTLQCEKIASFHHFVLVTPLASFRVLRVLVAWKESRVFWNSEGWIIRVSYSKS